MSDLRSHEDASEYIPEPDTVQVEVLDVGHTQKASLVQYFHFDKLYTWCALFVSLGGFMFGFDTFVFALFDHLRARQDLYLLEVLSGLSL
jgi:hypothetical protein